MAEKEVTVSNTIQIGIYVDGAMRKIAFRFNDQSNEPTGIFIVDTDEAERIREKLSDMIKTLKGIN